MNTMFQPPANILKLAAFVEMTMMHMKKYQAFPGNTGIMTKQLQNTGPLWSISCQLLNFFRAGSRNYDRFRLPSFSYIINI